MSSAAQFLEGERDAFFLWTPVCLGAGIALYFSLRFEPSLYASFIPFAAAACVRRMVSRGTIAAALCNALLLCTLGFGLAKLRVEAVRGPVLVKALHGVEVRGVVKIAEARPPRGQRLSFAVERIEGLGSKDTPLVVRLRTMSNRVLAKAGDRVRLKATLLAAPSRPVLPGSFDYARLAWFERVGGTGYAFAAPVVEGEAQVQGLAQRFGIAVERIRHGINARIVTALPGENGAIASALITGERGGISTETNSAFKNSGLFHILSISGLHMVIMAGAVFYMTRLALAAVPALALRLPTKKIAAVAGMASALAYLSISGGAFATVRSAVMILIIFGAVLLDRPALALRNVAIAALIILLAFPESLLDAGFQMSFAAVTALVASSEAVRRRLHAIGPGAGRRFLLFFGEIVVSTLIASAAVAPFAAFQFHQSQQYAVLANVIAIPICNFLVMPAALLALVLMPAGLEGLALVPMDYGIEAMKWCANLVARLPGAVGHIPAIPSAAFALMLTGGLWLALWRTRLRFAGPMFILAGLALSPLMPRPDVIVAQNGRLVAVRDGEGRLEALAARRSKFEVERWLEYDGDGRTAGEAQSGRAFRCDGVGCTAHVKGQVVSVARSPAAIADDCSRADILVLNAPRPKDCARPTRIVDVFDVWRDGNYALYLGHAEDGAPQVRVETVAAARGERPWSMPPPRRLDRVHRNESLPVPTIAASPHAEGAPSGRKGPLARKHATPSPGRTAERSAQSEDPAESPDEANEEAATGGGDGDPAGAEDSP